MRALTAIVFLLCLLPGLLQAEEKYVTLDDGSSIKVFLFYPKNADEGPWPLTVLMSGGSANEYIVRAQFWLGHELANRGWAIAVPVSPDGDGFFGKIGESIPQVIAKLQQDIPEIDHGKSLLVGVSNGGSSALEIASRHPENYFGVVAVPGIIKDSENIGDFKGLPVYVRIGENDFLRWNRLLPQLKAELEAAGARVNAKLEPGANHVFPINWEELQPWLDEIRETANTPDPAKPGMHQLRRSFTQ
ncbi:MAG: dienelactone hydrolase family protein [Pseudomonadales bacterium]|nr:dienelactone hydrolase family protein [Pseudomonadales bacterium]